MGPTVLLFSLLALASCIETEYEPEPEAETCLYMRVIAPCDAMGDHKRCLNWQMYCYSKPTQDFKKDQVK